MNENGKSTIEPASPSSNGLYVGFRPTPERMARGAYAATCKRCSEIVGHWPRESVGHEIICLKCANDIPAIRRHLDELAKTRGE